MMKRCVVILLAMAPRASGSGLAIKHLSTIENSVLHCPFTLFHKRAENSHAGCRTACGGIEV